MTECMATREIHDWSSGAAGFCPGERAHQLEELRVGGRTLQSQFLRCLSSQNLSPDSKKTASF